MLDLYDDIPYFMTNEEWYYYDPNDGEHGLKLTDKAPPEAVESYEEFYREDIEIDENGETWIWIND